MVRFHWHAVGSIEDGHGGTSAEEFRQETDMMRRLMRHHNERHAAIGRHIPEEGLERVQTAGRGANADYEKSLRLSHDLRTLQALPGRPG
jgi:hypothetical protein